MFFSLCLSSRMDLGGFRTTYPQRIRGRVDKFFSGSATFDREKNNTASVFVALFFCVDSINVRM